MDTSDVLSGIVRVKEHKLLNSSVRRGYVTSRDSERNLSPQVLREQGGPWKTQITDTSAQFGP